MVDEESLSSKTRPVRQKRPDLHRSAYRHRKTIDIVSRAVAAMVGGFCFASAFVVFLSLLLPGTKIQAVISASLIGFTVWTAAAIVAFATKTAIRAWIWIILCAGLLSLFVFYKSFP